MHCLRKASSTQPRYPDIRVKLAGKDSNALAILGRSQQALRRRDYRKPCKSAPKWDPIRIWDEPLIWRCNLRRSAGPPHRMFMSQTGISQISLAYSAIARSEENQLIPAMFRIAAFRQRDGDRQSWSTFRCALQYALKSAATI